MSGIEFAGLSPHPPVAVPEVGQDAISEIKETVNSMKKLAQQVKDADPDLVITISPHGPVFSDAINILNKSELSGNLGQFGAKNVELSYSLDEKFAELAMEWVIRYYDMIRHDKYGELSYDGRDFSAANEYLPYPQAQLDALPIEATAVDRNTVMNDILLQLN
jgi:hypothetical protein